MDLSSEMASLDYSLYETTLGSDSDMALHHLKQGFDLDLSPSGGNKMAFDNYRVAPNSPFMDETNDAQVPGFTNPPRIIMDLSDAVVSATVLDTPAIIDSFVDQLPFSFNSGAIVDPIAPADDMTPAILGFEVDEKFQDLTQLIVDRPLVSISRSPGPLISPTESVYSDVTQSSSTSLLSAASTSTDTVFFVSDIEMVTETSSTNGPIRSRKGDRYSEMRIRNNMASRRSRLTRRERERDMETQLTSLFDENASLKSKVRELEVLVEKTKKIIMQAVAKR